MDGCVYSSVVLLINTDNTFHFSGVTVQLESESLQVNEGDGSVDVCVVLSGNEDCPVYNFHSTSPSMLIAALVYVPLAHYNNLSLFLKALILGIIASYCV